MRAVRWVVLTLLVLAALAGAGFGGWTWWKEHDRVTRTATAWSLLEEGKLREAKGVAESLRTDYPDVLESYIVSAWVLRALHDRPATAEVLQQGYDVAPKGFPMLAEHVDHRLRGPDDPRKAYDTLAFLDQHLRTFPEDANIVNRGRLVALAYLIGQKGLPSTQLLEARAMAEEALNAYKIEGTGSTGEHYDRAQTLLALGKFDRSIEEGRAGIAAGTDKWQSLVMRWAITTAMLHHGQDEEAWAEMQQIQKELGDWPGTHFGQGKPLLELIQLTAGVRFGRKVAAPDGYQERLKRLDEEGVRLQYGDEETRGLVGQLLTAIDNHDADTGLLNVSDLLSIVERDRGCEMENQIIRPNTKAMLLAARGDLLRAKRQFDDAKAAYEEAQGLFPEDPWFDVKVQSVQVEQAGDDFNPVDLRSTKDGNE